MIFAAALDLGIMFLFKLERWLKSEDNQNKLAKLLGDQGLILILIPSFI